MDDSKDVGFLVIPNNVLRLNRYNSVVVGFPEKCLYSYLLNWQNYTDQVFPSSAKMCEDLGIGSRTSMKKYLDKLVSLGLISIVKSKGKSSTYRVISLDASKCSYPDTDSLRRGTNSFNKNKKEVQ